MGGPRARTRAQRPTLRAEKHGKKDGRLGWVIFFLFPAGARPERAGWDRRSPAVGNSAGLAQLAQFLAQFFWPMCQEFFNDDR
jgi:hypothetical protein